MDHLMGCLTDAGCPLKESCLIPFAVQLMVGRHMFRQCGILPAASVKALMAADPVPLVVNLNAAFGVPDIHFFTYILVRNRVVLKIYGDMKWKVR